MRFRDGNRPIGIWRGATMSEFGSDKGQRPPERPERPERPAHKVPFWIKLLLGVSLGANLLVIGLAAGAAWRFSNAPSRDGARGGFAFVSALEREDRRALFAQVGQARRDMARQGREDISAVLDLLRAEELDRALLEARISGFNDRNQGMRSTIQAGLVEQIVAMTPQERAAYAERLERQMKEGRGPRRARE